MTPAVQQKTAKPNPALPGYILITPAKNEAQFIDRTIQCMVAQTLRPVNWVIVSDGSADGTDEIVAKYLPDHPWIELLRMPERRERHFAGKVQAFNAGRAKRNWLGPVRLWEEGTKQAQSFYRA